MTLVLHRYVFRELLKVFVLAAIGLTLVLSLGGILRSVQEYGVGPRQVVDILIYFMPVMLTFVLPVAALFAGALVYGRLASDNELDASRASGICILTLVYPGFVLAILVAIVNLLLSFHVMPYFVHLAERAMKADAKQILFRNIQRRGFYGLPPDQRYLIYADAADLENDTLRGIVVVQCEGGEIREIISAERARVRFDLHDKYNEVQLTAYNTRQVGVGANDLWFELGTVPLRQEFGSLLGDKIKFKRIAEMKQIRHDLMLFDPVARLARVTYAQLATELLAQDIARSLSGGPGSAYELQSPSRRVRFSATACVLQEQAALTLLPPVVVEEYDGPSGRPLRRLQCQKAAVHVEGDSSDLRVSLDLRNARVEETEQLLIQHGVSGLVLPGKIARRLTGKPLLETVASAPMASLLGAPPSSMLDQQQKALQWKISRTLTNIQSEINSRLVFGLGCIPMILIGICLGILQKGGHLLSAFGASCLPATLLAMAIISGKQVAENPRTQGPFGILLMWAGLALLVLLMAFMYRKLLRT
jgi:lipopolysaccharide export LptBFGC system permease protein LptF